MLVQFLMNTEGEWNGGGLTLELKLAAAEKTPSGNEKNELSKL